MRLSATPLVFLLLAAAAGAQTSPLGSGLLTIKESLKVGGGCGSFRGEGVIAVSLLPNGAWTVQAPAGDFSGTLSPADPKGRSWNLQFDGPSLDSYQLYLEDVASELCGADVSISSGLIEPFRLKFNKDRTSVSFQLKTSATGSTAFGSGRGKHRIKGKGAFALAP
jgi:hypothetical protein